MLRNALVIIGSIVVSACGGASDASSENKKDALVKETLAPESTLVKPGFVVGVVSSEGLQTAIVSGAADIEQARPVDENTVFHIASLSKQVTAAALAHAILEERVTLDDPVSKWIPATAKYGSGLTIAHLLFFTSGLREYYDVPRTSGMPWSTFHYFTIDDAIRHSLSVDELDFEPGAQWRYSNINYMLIAKVVEAAYEKPFSAVVKEKLFAPLGMDSSLIHDDVTTIIPNRANAYFPRSDESVSYFNNDLNIDVHTGNELMLIRRNAPHYGGSGVFTSASDWSKWQQEILTRKVFGDRFWELMFSTRKFEHDKSNDAFGLVHSTYEGQKMLWYAGGDIDVSSYVATLPENDLSVFCFANNPRDNCEDKVYQSLETVFEIRSADE
ncbi:MAG: serine hydrolase domain-containing protein [Pseudomonadota bacterium]